jgi:hypothetical protein
MALTNRHFKPGSLKLYVKDHPNSRFAVSSDMYGFTIQAAVKLNSLMTVLGPTVAHYSRDRDAWRALRDLGYVQEGRWWRKAKQETKDETTEQCEAEKTT